MKSLFLLLMTFVFISCGKEQFATVPQSESTQANGVQVFEEMTCSNHTLIKPPVDILFVVDNSPSSSYMSSSLKSEIARTVTTISQDFDFHIMVAPLLASSGEDLTRFQLITSSWDTLNNPFALNIKSPNEIEFFQTVTGNNQETGFQRVRNIIDANRSNNVFRTGAYTLVVMISNGDDTDVLTTIGGQVAFDLSKYNAHLSAFKQYTKRYADSTGGGSSPSSNVLRTTSTASSLLKSEQFRFMSVVSFSSCQAGAKANQYYKKMSQDLYSWSQATDQASSASPDSYDICQNQYSSLFNSVNNSIHQLIIAHKYNYWLVTNNTAANIDTNDITVMKVMSNGSKVNIPNSATNGFQYVGAKVNQNTRYEPTAGEPQSGLMIQLFGTGRVTYPECLLVKTRTPTEYFGWVVIPREPKPSTIAVKVRGSSVPSGGANGWTYEGYKLLQNIKVPGPNGEPDTPAIKKTGYFIKLNGTSIYQSGDSVEVYYQPAPL